jgi:hypothetical protein
MYVIVASMMEDLILQHHPTTVLIKKDISIENNDRQEKDLDNEVEFTNGQVIFLFKEIFRLKFLSDFGDIEK